MIVRNDVAPHAAGNVVLEFTSAEEDKTYAAAIAELQGQITQLKKEVAFLKGKK